MRKTEAQMYREWADDMLEEATDDMSELNIEITPEKLSKFFEKNYEVDFSPMEAEAWLHSRKWYKDEVAS
jgi:hypothetical protein